MTYCCDLYQNHEIVSLHYFSTCQLNFYLWKYEVLNYCFASCIEQNSFQFKGFICHVISEATYLFMVLHVSHFLNRLISDEFLNCRIYDKNDVNVIDSNYVSFLINNIQIDLFFKILFRYFLY